MGIQADSRSQLVLSLLSWAVVIVLYLANKWFIARRPVPEELAPTAEPRRVLVLANETAELRRAARRIAPHRRRPRRQLLRRRPGQPDRDRCRRDARPARRDGGDPGGRQGTAGPHPVDTALGEPARSTGAGGLPAAAGTGQRRRHFPPGSDRDRDAAARSVGLAPLRRRRPGARGAPGHPGHPRRGDPGGAGSRPS